MGPSAYKTAEDCPAELGQVQDVCCQYQTPCGLGGGHCDYDYECTPGLVCGMPGSCKRLFNPNADPKSQCCEKKQNNCDGAGGGKGHNDIDKQTCCTVDQPCRLGSGHCGSDKQCYGDLTCGYVYAKYGHRGNCVTKFNHTLATLYSSCCEKRKCDGAIGKDTCCSKDRPCDLGEGNCHSLDQYCSGALVCGARGNCKRIYGHTNSRSSCCELGSCGHGAATEDCQCGDAQCTPGQTCENGQCKGGPCGNGIVKTECECGDAKCKTGQRCVNGQCLGPCGNEAATTDCACGDDKCTAGQRCVNGQCLAPPPPCGCSTVKAEKDGCQCGNGNCRTGQRCVQGQCKAPGNCGPVGRVPMDEGQMAQCRSECAKTYCTGGCQSYELKHGHSDPQKNGCFRSSCPYKPPAPKCQKTRIPMGRNKQKCWNKCAQTTGCKSYRIKYGNSDEMKNGCFLSSCPYKA